MRPYRTKVIYDVCFWRVQVYRCGEWQTMRDLYPTRAKARAGRLYWSNF